MGGTAPYTYIIASGALPAGLGINPATGVISGVPLQAGLFNFTVRATDAVGCIGSRAYVLAIVAAAPPAAAGIATLDVVGLTILGALLAAAGLFALKGLSI